MSTTWTFAQFADALKVAIDPLVSGLDPAPEVRVSYPHQDESLSDFIALGINAEDQLKEQMGIGSHSHDEEVLLGCITEVIRYGSGDEDALLARDAVLTYVAIIDEYLRENPLEVGTQTLRAVLGNRIYRSAPVLVGANAARIARIEFDIDYRARTNP